MNAALALAGFLCAQPQVHMHRDLGWAPNQALDMRSALAAAELGDYPTLIACLQKAIVIDPNDAAARHGLALARVQVDYPDGPMTALIVRESEWYPYWLFHPFFTIFGYFAWCGVCFTLARWWRYGRRAWLITGLILVPFALVPPANEGVRSWREAREKAAPFVVVQNPTDLRAGNGVAYPLVMHLPRGVECRFLGDRSGWCLIEFASGLTGWAPHSDLIGGIPP